MTLQSFLRTKFPENSYQGQCFTFLHKVCNFPPVGNFLYQKVAALKKFGIPIQNLDEIKLGDIVLTDEDRVFGHGFIVNQITGSNLQATESNYHYNGKVHHMRLISDSNPHILGVFRVPLLFTLPSSILRVKLVQNGNWDLGSKFAEIRQRLLDASKNWVDINIDVDHIDTQVPITSQGYPIWGGADLNWYAQNILPHKGKYHVVCLLTGTNPATGNSFGWHTPGFQIQVFADENETVTSANYGTMSVFIQAFLHEIQHCLIEMQGIPDNVHKFLNNQPPGQPPPQGIFQLQELMGTYNMDVLENYLDNH